MIQRLYLIVAMALLLWVSCSKPEAPLPDVQILSGKWKVEGKNVYEQWQLDKEGNLTGMGYSLVEGEKIIRERLSVKSTDGSIVYMATVPDQNKGASIPFFLNKKIDTLLSFENLDHDFPKKIQYQKVSDESLAVFVTGEADQGFSLVLNRVKE